MAQGMAGRKLPPSVTSFLAEYMDSLRGQRAYHLGGARRAHLETLLKVLEREHDTATLQSLLLLMLYFGTTLQSGDLIGLSTDHAVTHPSEGLAFEIPLVSRVRKSRKPAPWTGNWTPHGEGPAKMWVTADGGVPGQLAAEGELTGQGPTVKRVWLDDETERVLELLLKLLPPGRRLLFSGPHGAALHVEDVYRMVDEAPGQADTLGLSNFFPIYSETDYEVIPTPLRLNADQRFSGKGVTIAFIDSGFYPHPDLTQPVNRVLAYRNLAQQTKQDFGLPSPFSWHGMQTSVSAAGNGYLSRGLYKGLAHGANVVLLRVSGPMGIEQRHILDAFRWVARNKERYNIRVVNVSLGGGEVVSSRDSELDQAAEALVQLGICVVVAAGNDGRSPDPRIRPPASAPSVITVGGLNDKNKLDYNDYEMYWSSYGRTLDGILKPDIIAPGIWVAAPMLPGTPIYEEAQLLQKIKATPDDELVELVKGGGGEGGWSPEVVAAGPEAIRKEAQRRQKMKKVIFPSYQHVDGTSFAAPIVCSVVAQMLEANPGLTPRRVKQLLLSTTDKLFKVAVEKQGHGLIHPRKAVKEAINDLYRDGRRRPASPFVKGHQVTFMYRTEDPDIQSVSVAGDFNNWNPRAEPLTLVEAPDLWAVTRKFEGPGSFRYKFVLNGDEWIEDPENLNRDPDGFGGYNTRLVILV